MTKVELEYDLMKSFMIRHIGWEADNCIIKAKQWAPKVIQAFPELFPNEKVLPPKEEDSKINVGTKTTAGAPIYGPAPVKSRSVGRRT
jgi:hypothetical protein